MRIVFIGPPGAGKGTQAARLCARFGIPHVSTGDALRCARTKGDTLAEQVGPIMDAGRLVDDDLMIQVVRRRFSDPDCHAGFLLDGFPRTVPQAVALVEILDEFDWKLNAVLEIQVPREELIRRLQGRATESPQPRADDHPNAIPQRLEIYERETAPVLAFYRERDQIVPIDGTGVPDEVFDRIVSGLSHKPQAL